MGIYFIQNNKISKLISGILLVLFLLQPVSALAIVYQAGQTLDPSCLPTDTTCGVTPPTQAPETGFNFTSATIAPSSTENQLYNLSGILYWGATAIAGLSAPVSLSSLNGLATSTQTFVVGSGGADFNIVSSGSAHTFNFPTASSTTRGLLSSADWSIFNNKENAIIASTTATYWRGDKTFQTLDTSVVPENGNVYYTSARFTSDFATKSTSNLTEGANLYYTDARARNALSATSPISYASSTGVFSLATGNITAPSNSEITITGGTGAVIGSGLTFVIPEANATTRGLISTTTQAIAGDKTFSGALTVSNVPNPNAFIVTSNGNVGIGTVPDSTKQFQVKFDADKGALFDGRTNPRTVTVGVVRFEHTAGAEGTKPVFYDIDAVGYANTHATEVIYKTGAMTGEANVHDIIIDGTGAMGGKIHGLQVDVLAVGGLGKVIGLGVDPHVDPIEQHTGAYIDDTKSWYYNLSTYTDITAGTNTVFNVNNSYVYVGADTAFTAFQVTLPVVASKNISPIFEFWNGTAWTAFSPTDGTNGFTNSGVISVTAPSWATTTVNGVSKFYVRIRRTINNLNTPPQISLIQTNNAIEYYWDKTGKIKINAIETTGNVGIGTSTPGYLLTMGIGGGYYNQATGAWVNGSDRAYKDNILMLEKYGLETVMGLSPVSYVVKHSGIEQVGFIAQEVRDIVPELVSGEDGAMGVNYGGFTPILVKAIQEITSLADSFKINLITWFADATNGIADFFAKKMHTEQICLKKSDGSEYCVNGDDLEAIMLAPLEAARARSASLPLTGQDRGEVIQVQPPVAEINPHTFSEDVESQESGLGSQLFIPMEKSQGIPEGVGINLMTESPTATEAEQGLPIIEDQELVSTDTASSTETIIEETSSAVETQSSEEIAEPEAGTIVILDQVSDTFATTTAE